MTYSGTPQTMQAVSVQKTGIGLEEVPIPAPGPGEVLVEVLRCGICGSDLHLYSETDKSRAACPGHEILGRVASEPPTDSGFSTGDRVTIEATRTCGGCPACQRGDSQLCNKLKILGVHLAGGFAEFVLAQVRQLHLLPETIGNAAAALAEPLAVAIHAERIAGGVQGRRVLVVGAGSIGLLTAFVARQTGAAHVAITARRPHQRQAAEHLGIDEVLVPGGRDPSFDTVFETVGGPADASLTEAIQCTRSGGRVVLLGLFQEPPRLPALELMAREIQLHGANCYGQGAAGSDFERAHDLLVRHGRLLSKTLVTHSFALADFGAALETAADKTTGSIKVQVCCD
jgi:2-desacetyl-2-hydroxyethyl bacteriochlorophyllide A dehydrogenase